MENKILVIDDEQGIRDLFCFLLKPYEFQVFTACNGMEGLEAFKKGLFDIVFLDVHMPGMNGMQVLEAIKQIRPGQIVIIFSSSSDPEYIFENAAKKTGVRFFLYKPFNADEILKAIEESLNGNKGTV